MTYNQSFAVPSSTRCYQKFPPALSLPLPTCSHLSTRGHHHLAMFPCMFQWTIVLLVAVLSPSHAETTTNLVGGEMLNPLSLQSLFSDSKMVVHENYPLGDPNAEQKTFVTVYKPNSFSSGVPLAKRDSTPSTSPIIGTRVDLTPSECTSQACYPGSYQAPDMKDCQVIVAAQLYNSTGSLTAAPGRYVIVHSNTCVVVFQNPITKHRPQYTLDYNWASLGKVMLGLIKKCKMSQGESIGGACKIDHYLSYHFHNVMISLQRYDNSPGQTLDR